jgi:uncharacterized protein
VEAIVGLLTVELHLPEAETLKDKRQVIHSLLDRLANRFNVSVAEVDHLDSHQRAVLAVAAVANDAAFVGQVLDKVRGQIEAEPRALLVDSTVDFF